MLRAIRAMFGDTIARHCRCGRILAAFEQRKPVLIINIALFWRMDDRLLQARARSRARILHDCTHVNPNTSSTANMGSMIDIEQIMACSYDIMTTSSPCQRLQLCHSAPIHYGPLPPVNYVMLGSHFHLVDENPQYLMIPRQKTAPHTRQFPMVYQSRKLII
jgi:hypothetical protein